MDVRKKHALRGNKHNPLYVETCEILQAGKHLLNVWLENNRRRGKKFFIFYFFGNNNNFLFDSKVWREEITYRRVKYM